MKEKAEALNSILLTLDIKTALVANTAADKIVKDINALKK